MLMGGRNSVNVGHLLIHFSKKKNAGVVDTRCAVCYIKTRPLHFTFTKEADSWESMTF